MNDKAKGSERRLQYVQISPRLGDETVTFEVKGFEGMTVREFIDNRLYNGTANFGTFTCRLFGKSGLYAALFNVEYKDNALLPASVEKAVARGGAPLLKLGRKPDKEADQMRRITYAEALEKALVYVWCNGGWGRMDYVLYV